MNVLILAIGFCVIGVIVYYVGFVLAVCLPYYNSRSSDWKPVTLPYEAFEIALSGADSLDTYKLLDLKKKTEEDIALYRRYQDIIDKMPSWALPLFCVALLFFVEYRSSGFVFSFILLALLIVAFWYHKHRREIQVYSEPELKPLIEPITQFSSSSEFYSYWYSKYSYSHNYVYDRVARVDKMLADAKGCSILLAIGTAIAVITSL